MNLSPDMVANLLQRAIANLKAIGAHYRIDTGTALIDTFPEKAAPIRSRVIVNNWVRITGYTVDVRALRPGDLKIWARADYPSMKEERGWRSFCASVAHVVKADIGESNFLMERTDTALTIVREA